MSDHVLSAKRFYLTEPSRGLFVVNFQIGGELKRMTISRNQLANFLVDGAGMALRSQDLAGRSGVQAAPADAEMKSDHQTSEAI